jgi:hypothetical protein
VRPLPHELGRMPPRPQQVQLAVDERRAHRRKEPTRKRDSHCDPPRRNGRRLREDFTRGMAMPSYGHVMPCPSRERVLPNPDSDRARFSPIPPPAPARSLPTDPRPAAYRRCC